MSIQPKDIKLLWGNAANRCSMPDCRRPLVAETGHALPSTVVLGEMAHIVGEKNSSDSPRGLSILPLPERNNYPNLILLCAHHHTLIDKDEDSWPVERLHIIKREHELWVDTQLGQGVDQQIQIYHDFIDRVTIALHLVNWEWLCDCLYRQIMPVDFPDGIYQLGFEHFRAIMPKKLPDFEAKLQNLVNRSREYVDHYMSNAVITPGDPRIMGKKLYKNYAEDNYEIRQKALDEYNKWERNCTMLLCNLVLALNEFAEAVRKDLNPDFFIRKGKFCVHDFMGLSNELRETWYLPPEYYTKAALDAPYLETETDNTDSKDGEPNENRQNLQ